MSQGKWQGRRAKALQNSIGAVIDQLEARRFLSADASVVEEEVVADDSVVEYTTLELVDEGTDAEEELIYTTLMVEDGETIDGGEVVDGDIPEEWMYMTGVGEEGEVVGDGEVADGEVEITMVGEDGEPVGPTDEGNPDINGDGVVDELDTVLYMTGGPAPTRLKPNGTLLINGTGDSDEISVSRNGDKVVVNLNGTNTEYDATDVDLIKIAAGAGNDEVNIDVNTDARVQGGRGNDSLAGGDGDDSLFGGKGNDDLNGGGGDDDLRGHRGDDNINGGDGGDDLTGGRGNDNLLGGDGDDEIRGGRGADDIDAGPGNDRLNGGGGLDDLKAGLGIDAEQDPSDNLRDGDADDGLFASMRWAHPGWWQEQTGDEPMNIVIDDGSFVDVLGGDEGEEILM